MMHGVYNVKEISNLTTVYQSKMNVKMTALGTSHHYSDFKFSLWSSELKLLQA